MKRTHCIAGLVLTAVIVYATLSLTAVMSDLNEAKAATAELKAQLTRAQEENAGLEADIGSLGNDKTLEELARERLGLVRADEVVFVDMK